MNVLDKSHEDNWKTIMRLHLKIGTQLKYKPTGEIATVTFIHPIYGWVIATGCYHWKQGMSNIEEFERLGVIEEEKESKSKWSLNLYLEELRDMRDKLNIIIKELENERDQK
jgi:hypothetical protein